MKHPSNRYSSKYKNKSNSADGKNKVAKKQRGFFDYKNDGNVYVRRWNDSSVVTLASNHLTHLPVGKTKHYSKKQKKRIEVPMPHIVKNYNESMGGVDTMDKILSSYGPKMRSKKWWGNLFNNALNIAVVAAWRLHCELHDAHRTTMTHLAFGRDIKLISVQPGLYSSQGLGHVFTCHTVCKAHVDNFCSQVRRVDAQFAKKIEEITVFSVENGCIRYVSQNRISNCDLYLRYHNIIV
ncbi:PiggyBac transposable element-derived protein 3 [Trichinella sp. T9]|nr:PiggyBac transposable element-derived protein 3 [Trichinella sp. T9]